MKTNAKICLHFADAHKNVHFPLHFWTEQAQIPTALVFDFYNVDCPPWEDEVRLPGWILAVLPSFKNALIPPSRFY